MLQIIQVIYYIGQGNTILVTFFFQNLHVSYDTYFSGINIINHINYNVS